MYFLKLRFVCCPMVIDLITRQIQTSCVLSLQKKKKFRKSFKLKSDLMKKIEGPEPIETESIYDEEYNEDYKDINFMNIEKFYDEHVSEEKLAKKAAEKKMIEYKFFRPKKQPSMLTWDERNYIKYLNNVDPVQWNPDVLSETFPATVDTIKKVLKSKAKLTPEKKKKMDENVNKNWELLLEGKLDADPDLLDHFKKFVNSRQKLLEEARKNIFYFPEIKKEVQYNNGEMNSILIEYENCINDLYKIESSKCLQIEGEKEGKENSHSDFFDKNDKEKIKKRTHRAESFNIEKMVKTYQEDLTFGSSQRELEYNKELNSSQRIIIDANIKNSNIQERTENFLEKKMKRKQKNIEMLYELDEGDDNDLKKNIPPSEKCKILVEGDTGKTLVFNENQIPSLSKKQKEDNENTKGIDLLKSQEIENVELNIFKDGVAFEKCKDQTQENIKEKKAKLSKEKKELKIKNEILERNEISENKVENFNKLKSNVLFEDYYPEKIVIPKDKRYLGSLFKIKDCYYDKNGEFLYRVPGMMN